MLEEYHKQYGKEPYKPLLEVLARIKCISHTILSNSTSPTTSQLQEETNTAEDNSVQGQLILQH